MARRRIGWIAFCCLLAAFAGAGCSKKASAGIGKKSAAPPFVLGQTPKKPEPAAVQAAAALRAQFPAASVAWDPRTGYAKSVEGLVGPQAADANDPARSARDFLTANAALFGLPAAALPLQVARVSEAQAEKGGVTSRYVRFYQTIREVPVLGGEMVVHLTASSRVHTIFNSYKPLTSIEGEVKLSREDAIARAQATFPPGTRFEVVDAKRVIFPRGTVGIQAWRAALDGWAVVLNAATGEVLLRRDETRYQSARVFRENAAVDNNTTSDLPIANLDTSGTLTGSRFFIVNTSGTTETSTAQNFLANPSSVNFDDQMAYFHLETMANYFNGLGFANPSSALMARTRVDFELEICNSGFVPNSQRFIFGVEASGGGCGGSGGCQPPAHFADVICHEYTHFVLNTLSGVTGGGIESDAIHEGTADYFSDSHLGNPCTGEKFLPDKPCARDALEMHHYPQDMSPDDEAHVSGQVWTSALWDLRQRLGAAVADRAVAAGMMGLPSDPTFDVFAGNILKNGAAFYVGLVDDNGWANIGRLLTAAAIAREGQRTFCDHGIVAPYGTFVDLTVHAESGAQFSGTVSVPTGMVVDKDRGCAGGFDVLAPGGWRDLKYFIDNRSQLTNFQQTLTDTSLTVSFSVPGGCGGVQPISLDFRLYAKSP